MGILYPIAYGIKGSKNSSGSIAVSIYL